MLEKHASCSRPPAARETLEPKGRWIDDRAGAGDEIGYQTAGGGTDAEAVAGKSAREIETRQRLNRRDHGNRVGRDVDQPRPSLHDRNILEHGKGQRQVGFSLVEDRIVRGGIEHADGFERRWVVQRPVSGNVPLLDEAPPGNRRNSRKWSGVIGVTLALRRATV